MKNIISILLIALFFTGCEKTIDLKYKGNQARIIIEGNITNEPGPYIVKVTKSLSLKDTSNYPTVDDAVVTISDDAGNNEALVPNGNGLYHTTTFTASEGRTYTLSVNAENQTYIAQSIMPGKVSFDSIKVEEFTFGGETERNLIPVYKDPVEKGNNYRFVLSVNNKIINQHFIRDDVVTNGIVNTQRLEINDNEVKLRPGDIISITMQCVDEKAGLYYKTLALMGDSGPGGGTTPNNPPNNFSNGALGIFSAHTVQNRTTVLQ